jgi:hypothetical protein
MNQVVSVPHPVALHAEQMAKAKQSSPNTGWAVTHTVWSSRLLGMGSGWCVRGQWVVSDAW